MSGENDSPAGQLVERWMKLLDNIEDDQQPIVCHPSEAHRYRALLTSMPPVVAMRYRVMPSIGVPAGQAYILSSRAEQRRRVEAYAREHQPAPAETVAAYRWAPIVTEPKPGIAVSGA